MQKKITSTVSQSFSSWNSHDAPRLGAALAFYSLLSLSPLLVLVTAIAGLVFGHSTAEHQLLRDVGRTMGNEFMTVMQGAIEHTKSTSSNVWASVAGLVTLFLGASGVFTELQDDLNVIWNVPPRGHGGLRAMLMERIFAFGMVVAIGFLLVLSLIASFALTFMEQFFNGILPIPGFALGILNFLVSAMGVTLCFALIFKYVPDTRVSWRPVWRGALMTAILFTIGKSLIGLYLGRAAIGSPYGAAGSLVLLTAWVYYSAMLFLFGAEFTHVLANPKQP